MRSIHALLVPLLAVPLPAAQSAAQAPQLFRPAPSTVAVFQEDLAVRQTNVLVDFALLGDPVKAGADHFDLNLFEDVVVPASFSHAEEAWGGGYVTHAALLDDPWGAATFSIVDGVVVGTIRHHDALYRLNSAGAGVTTISEIAETRFPPCANDLRHEEPVPPGGGGFSSEPEPPPGFRTMPTIDVMVVYTTAARTAQGGAAAIQALINLAVTETNTAYSNSRAHLRINLTSQRHLAGYVEHGDFNTELDRLTNTTDGHIDTVHTWRNADGADCVAMIIDSDGSACGLAWLMTSLAMNFDKKAFSVTADNCATGYYSFGHELGHNMGSAHDRANANSGLRPYSFGYHWDTNSDRSIMAYAPGTRRQYFSNPNVNHGGHATGKAHPSATSAENWRSLTNAAGTVRRFRQGNTPVLWLTRLRGGRSATLYGENLTPGGLFHAGYSWAGGGPINHGKWGQMCLSNPWHALDCIPIDNNGKASKSFSLPSNTFGRQIWWHGVDATTGNKTNGYSAVID